MARCRQIKFILSLCRELTFVFLNFSVKLIFGYLSQTTLKSQQNGGMQMQINPS